MLDAASIKATTRSGVLDAASKATSRSGVLDAASIKARTCSGELDAASNTKHDQLVEHPGMPGATAGQQRRTCPFAAWWDCTELQLCELVHSAP